MTLTAALALFAVLFLLAGLPTASTLLVAARSVQAGQRQAAAVIAGIVLGDVLFAALALAGLAALSGLLGAFFSLLKLLAGALLLWLGLQLLRGRAAPLPALSRRGGLAGGFAAGLALTLGDAKAIVFYAALLPAFVDLPALTAMDAAAVLLITVLAVGGAKALHARLAGHWAGRRPAWLPPRALPLAAGTAFAGSGLWLLSRPG